MHNVHVATPLNPINVLSIHTAVRMIDDQKSEYMQQVYCFGAMSMQGVFFFCFLVSFDYFFSMFSFCLLGFCYLD